MNPSHDECLILDIKNDVKYYYTLYAKRKNLKAGESEIKEDDCLVAYSDVSEAEIVAHRDKLIMGGYYKSFVLYTRNIPNFLYNKKIPEDVIYLKDFN